MHPLLEVLLAAAAGRFPAVDGVVEYLPPLDDGWEAVVALTGHAYVASRLGPADLAHLEPDGFGRALDPKVLLRMAGDNGSIGSTDVTLYAPGTGGGERHPNPVLDSHPRVMYAGTRRAGVKAYGEMDGLFTLGWGLAGRLEMSVETSGSSRRGRDLVEQALSLVPVGEPLFAAVAAGNARSMRAFLACGFTPIGGEVLVRPA